MFVAYQNVSASFKIAIKIWSILLILFDTFKLLNIEIDNDVSLKNDESSWVEKTSLGAKNFLDFWNKIVKQYHLLHLKLKILCALDLYRTFLNIMTSSIYFLSEF